MTIKQSILCFCLVLAFSLPAVAQFLPTAHNAQSAAMGGCLFVAQDNRERTLSLSYRQEYTLNGWADKEIGLLWPTLGRGIWIAHYHHFGDESYNEQQASAGYSLDVSESVQVGIIGQYCRLSVDDGWYEAQQWLSGAAFARIRVHNKLSLCMIGGYMPWLEKHPWGLRFGASYRPTPTLLTTIETEHCQRFRLHYGMEYCYRKNYFLRAGFATNPLVLTFGGGLRISHYQIDLSIESHSVLGITPQISFALCF